MSDTYNYIIPSGVIVPDLASLETVVKSEWTDIFGEDLPTDQSTPQGLMIASEVAARQGVVNNNATLANQINPNQAAGLFLDGICALTGLVRLPDTFTRAQAVTLAGVQGSPIAAGTIIATPDGDQFALDGDVTLDAVTGEATGLYTALVAGPIPAPSGLWTIVTDVLGLETVTNTLTGVLGMLQQSDEALATLRRKTLALQGVALIEAVLSAVNDVTNVIGSAGLENYTGSPVTIDGVVLKAHSIWVCADGGTNLDVATALLFNKSQGCDWNGSTTVNVVEPSSGQTYAVTFDRPTLVPLLVRVTCSKGTFIGSISTDVTNAVVDFANNAIDNLLGFVVSQSASPFEIAAGVMRQCPGLYVSKIEISLVSSVSYSTDEIAMLKYQKATVSGSDVSVVIV